MFLKFRKIVSLTYIFCFLFSGQESFAQMFRGPVSSSLGGTGRAGMPGAESAFLNPALLTRLSGMGISTYFHDGYLDEGEHRRSYGVGIFDNNDEAFMPGSLHYIRMRDTGLNPTPVDSELIHAAFAKDLFEMLSLGVSGYRLTHHSKSGDFEQWNFSFGLHLTFERDLAFSYTLNNLAKPTDKIDSRLRQDLEQTLGVYWNTFDTLRLRLDVVRPERRNPGKELNWGVGSESLFADRLLLRLGYRDDRLREQRFFTAGLGLHGPRLKMNYAVEKNLERTSGALHSVDLSVPF